MMSPIEYLQKVCGVDEIVLPETPRLDRELDILFWISKKKEEIAPEAVLLFEKMKSAMGLQAHHYSEQWGETKPSLSRLRIELTSSNSEIGWVFPENKVLRLPFLEDLLKDPNLKKPTWKLLQEAMGRLPTPVIS